MINLKQNSSVTKPKKKTKTGFELGTSEVKSIAVPEDFV